MPTDIDFLPIIEKLLARTREGKVAWKGTYDSNAFLSVIEGGFAFQIENTTVNAFESRRLTMTDPTSETVFKIRVTEPTQDTTQDNDKIFRVLEELWESARRAALDIDKKITEVSRILDNI
jgi:hypothetical protein